MEITNYITIKVIITEGITYVCRLYGLTRQQAFSKIKDIYKKYKIIII